MENRAIQHGVERYTGFPLDGTARRVMDVHNHPEGWPESASIEDSAFFLRDLDMEAQAVVSGRGTQIMVKPKDYSSGKFDSDEFEHTYREFHDQYLGNPEKRDREFARWTAKRYKLTLLWVKRGSNILLPVR